jgi:hypothetical protein
MLRGNGVFLWAHILLTMKDNFKVFNQLTERFQCHFLLEYCC